MLFRFCLCFVFLFALLAAGVSIPTLAADDADFARRFHDLLDAEWQYTLREAPTFASHLGDKRYNDRWPDVSLAAVARRYEHQKEVLGKLDQIDANKLSPSDRLNYALFCKEIANDVEQYPFHWHLVPLNQREGVQDESQLADALIFTTVRDYEDWISRLRSFPAYVQQTTELMRAGLKSGSCSRRS